MREGKEHPLSVLSLRRQQRETARPRNGGEEIGPRDSAELSAIRRQVSRRWLISGMRVRVERDLLRLFISICALPFFLPFLCYYFCRFGKSRARVMVMLNVAFFNLSEFWGEGMRARRERERGNVMWTNTNLHNNKAVSLGKYKHIGARELREY